MAREYCDRNTHTAKASKVNDPKTRANPARLAPGNNKGFGPGSNSSTGPPEARNWRRRSNSCQPRPAAQKRTVENTATTKTTRNSNE